MARRVGKMRGDMRAMEEQMMLPQSNPVRGGGATPSMGLSQFRGGGGMLGQDGHGQRVVGAGRRKKSSEAVRMGHALGSHINQLHGGGFFDDFKRGFDSVVAPVAGIAKAFLPMAGPEGMMASGVINALGYGRHSAYDRRRTGCGTGAGQLTITHGGGRERDDVAMLSGMGYGMGYSGCGDDTEEEEMEGGQSFANPSSMSMSGAYQGQGTGGRRRRASAGPNDGRRKRAEIVKRVMAEKGMKMIEASKYVKAHGLY